MVGAIALLCGTGDARSDEDTQWGGGSQVHVRVAHLGGALVGVPVRRNSVGGRDAAFVFGLVAPVPPGGTGPAPRTCWDVHEAVAP